MRTLWYSAKRNGTQVSIGKQVLSAATREREQKLQTEFELWEQQVKKEAQLEAGRGQGALALGGIEALLKRISEQVTREAQENKLKRASTVS